MEDMSIENETHRQLSKGLRVGVCCPSCNSSSIRFNKKLDKYICYSCKKSFVKPSEKLYKSGYSKKRKPTDMVFISKEDLLGKIYYLGTRDRALVSVLYLTGARVSEIVNRLTLKQIEPSVEKKIDNEIKHFIYFRNLFTLKKKSKDNSYRDIPVCIETDGEMVKYIDEYLDLMIANFGDDPDEILFKISRQRAFIIIKNKLGIYPHFLRTLRFTHLAQSGLDPYDLKKLANWSSIKPSEFYVHKELKDIEKKII